MWYYSKPELVDQLDYPFYVKPIKLNTNVTSLKFIRNFSSSIQETQVFGSNLTPIIQVLNLSNDPMAGKLVFALICNFNGEDYPKRYTNVRKGYQAKELLYPIPGIYSATANNPLSFDDPVIPILTNSKGYAFFNNSYFSDYGPYGNYKVEFICDGINLVSDYINVNYCIFI